MDVFGKPSAVAAPVWPAWTPRDQTSAAKAATTDNIGSPDGGMEMLLLLSFTQMRTPTLEGLISIAMRVVELYICQHQRPNTAAASLLQSCIRLCAIIDSLFAAAVMLPSRPQSQRTDSSTNLNG